MNNIPYDVVVMYIERVTDYNFLMAVSRVNRSFRRYVKNNFHRWRSIPISSVNILYPDEHTILIKLRMSGPSLDKNVRSISQILRYEPTFFVMDYSPLSDEQANQLESLFDSIPDLWFQNNVRGLYTIFTKHFPISIFQRFRQLEGSKIEFSDSLERMRKLIEIGHNSNRYWFVCKNMIADDSVIETIIQKSQSKPMEFPEFSGDEASFSLRQIIRLFEHHKFPEAIYNRIEILSRLKGKKNDWDNWLENNCTLPTEEQLQICNARKANVFVFRQKLFSCYIRGFKDDSEPIPQL